MKASLMMVACACAGMIFAGSVQAGPIGSACMKGRNAGSTVCGCIDQIADRTLSRSDQRRAAGLFKDPDKAQQIRMSDRQADNDFWARYKNFAATAEAYCTR